MELGGPFDKMIISIRRPQKDSRNELSSTSNNNKSWIESNKCDPKQYRITNLIHASESLNVYQADHIGAKRHVVIKMIDLDSEEFLESIIHEIRTITKLRHVNILPILATFVNGNHLWNVVAHAELGSADLWSKPNGLPELAIAFIIKDVLTALNYLHKRGIIHRGVCGSHILINANGNCMLTGLKYSTSVLQKGRWQPAIHQYPTNAVKLLNYLAPEILEQNLAGYNSKSDIYSVGIVCCELANGCIPFEDIGLTEMLLDKLTGNFPRPLDSTCEEIQKFPTDDKDISPEVREKYNLYKNRTFSSSFHTFTIERCLNFDTCSRPMASELLTHSFIKQTKKSNRKLTEIFENLQSNNDNNKLNNQSMMVTSSHTNSKPSQSLINNKITILKTDCNDEIDWIF